MSSIDRTSNSEEPNIKVHNMIWTIPKFVSLLEHRDTKDCKTEMTKTGTEFNLKIKFCGENNDLIEIYYSSRNPTFLKSTLAVGLNDHDERIITKIEYQRVAANKWQYLSALYKISFTCIEAQAKYLLPDRSFQLKFQFFVPNDVTVDNVAGHQLSTDLENLLNNSMFSDVILISAEGVEFKVHKLILSCRSTVLKAHFMHSTIESQSNVVNSHFDTRVIKEVLTYIYTDRAPRVHEIPDKLLDAADFYDLLGLKNICEVALHKGLTVENAIETLQLADLHSATNLKQLTLEFIKDGHAELITKTDSWKSIKSVEVIKYIYEFMMSQ